MGSVVHTSEESSSTTRSPTPNSSISSSYKTSLSTPLSSSGFLCTSSGDADYTSQNGLSTYISLGCLHYDLDSSVSLSAITTTWCELDLVQVSQLRAVTGLDVYKLHRAGWIRVVSRCSLFQGTRCLILRIYLRSMNTFADRENKPLKAALRSLLQRVEILPATWSGRHSDSSEPRVFDIWATGENESLFYLFNTIPSPDPKPDIITCPYSKQAAEDLLDSRNHSESGRAFGGLKTRLYEFQTKSAALMVQRESAPQKVLDPRFEPRYSLDNRLFYYNPKDMIFVLEPQYFESNRGGILAETMGIGKTLICLSVILATKDHLPNVPPIYQGAARVWGRMSHAGERSRPKHTGNSTLSPISDSPTKDRSDVSYYTTHNFWEVGTLAKMAAAAVTRNSIPWKRDAEIAQREECYRILEAAAASYDVPIEQARKNRSNISNATVKLTLCGGTLIVVPPNLLTQWQSEIKKHVADGYLKVLVLDNKYGNKVVGERKDTGEDNIFCTKLLPPSDVLRSYDIVLFSRPRFEQEIKDGSDSSGRRLFAGAPTICQCPYIGATRTPDCRCFKMDQIYRTPLKELHWLRMIIDEGHNFSSAKSNAVLIAGQIEADRRWVVSGTPAKDLVGVDVELPIIDENDIHSREAVMEKRRQFSKSDDMRAAVKSLGDLAKNFLKVQPWSDCNWEDYIYRNESYTHRTYTCFSASMKQTLSGLVIKTTPDIYEKEVSIPELTHTTVRLKPSWFDKMSANLFIHVLRANAITSERTDVDYLFHKNSVKARHSLLRNLRQSNFTWTGFTESQVRESIELCQTYLAKPDKMCKQEDVAALTESMQMIQQVLDSAGWLALSKTHEIGLFVEDWPQESIDVFALGGIGLPQMVGPTQLVKGQDHVNHQVSAEDPAAGLTAVGEVWKARIEESEKQEREEAKRKAVKSSEAALKSKGVPMSCLDEEPTAAKRSIPFRANPTPKKGAQGTHSANAPSAPNKTETPKSPARKRKLTLSDATKELPADSHLLKTSVIGTTSSKLSYLIDRVMHFQDEHKIIIFYDGENAAYYISQCLDFLHVSHRIYARTLNSGARDKYIQLFKEDANMRVLLMDVACGSHGLDLHVASVVLIVNPINRKDVEAQAIKRAHRIGQTKKVLVETLILEGTIEEAIFDAVVERTQNMRADDELHKAKTIEDDKQIEEIIQSARIVPVQEGEAEGYMQLARLKERQQVFARPGRARYDGALEKTGGFAGDMEKGKGKKKQRTKPTKTAPSAVPDDTPVAIRTHDQFHGFASTSATAPSLPAAQSLFGDPSRIAV